MKKPSSLLFFLLLFCSVGCSDSREETHLPDDRLIANFHAHRETFERLKEMILQDTGLIRIRDDWYDPRDIRRMGAEPERIVEYRRLFDRAGAYGGFYALPNRREIEIIASSHGWFNYSSEKGYLYSETVPEGMLENKIASLPWSRPALPSDGDASDRTASPTMREQRGKRMVRHIEGNWYLFYLSEN